MSITNAQQQPRVQPARTRLRGMAHYALIVIAGIVAGTALGAVIAVTAVSLWG
jgi:hypothetical protein